MKQTRFATLCVALGLASFFNLSAQAQMTTITDATNDIAAGIATAEGTLDIVKMEVGDTATDVVFKLTVNGNISSTDWGNFMIGIASQKTNGTITGNGWNRPINLNAGITNGVTNGMTHWIGSWVNGGGGSQLWTREVSSWSGPAALAAYSFTPGTQSVITYTVSKASLGVANGDTIKFDAYSSGGGAGDSAVDALANPNVSITGWGGPYTSSGANLASYTLAETMLNTTQTITFSVNMSHQILLGTFDPATDAVAVDWGTGFPPANFAYLTRVGTTSVYTGTATISAVQGTSVPYRFTIEPIDENDPLVPESVSRSFTMPGTALTVASSYYNNIEGYRDVTFAVNMSVQETLGTFNPATQTVEVRGPFNAWAGTALTAQGSGIYSGTVRISGAAGPVDYKFFAGSYESISGNRNFTLAFNEGGAPTPAQVLDTVFYNDVNVVPDFRPVTFAVNMNHQITLGRFVAGTDTLEVVGAMNGWNGGTSWQLTDGDSDGIYTGTFNIEGAAAATVEYKFRASGTASWESDPNRSLTLGPVQTPQNVSVVFFNNDSGATRQVTFAVDMSIQQALGKFNPATGTVQLRGLGSFDATDKVLAREGETAIFKGTFAVAGDAGASVSYKFFSTGVTESGFEIINPNDLFENRSLTLLASGTPMVLDPAYFSNQSAVPPSNLSYTPSTVSGTVGTAISSLTPTVTGTVTSWSVSPTLPAGLSFSGSTGEISGTPTAVAASASYTVTASNAGGSTTATVTVAVTAADPLADYMTSFGLTGADAAGDADPDGDGQNNNAELAFGTDPTNGSSRAATLASGTGTIKLVYLQRNSGITYTVKSFTDVTQSSPANFAGNGAAVTPVATDPQPAGVRAGYTQYEASVSTGPTRGFLRVRAVR